jgi:hypothetical protein
MEVQGRISKILPLRKGTRSDGSEWRSQEFIVEFFETADQRWSDKVVLNAMNERIDEYDLHEGEEVRVGFSHGVKEYQGRWYPEFHIYKFEKVVNLTATSPQPTIKEPTAPVPEAAQEKKDDLPF